MSNYREGIVESDSQSVLSDSSVNSFDSRSSKKRKASECQPCKKKRNMETFQEEHESKAGLLQLLL